MGHRVLNHRSICKGIHGHRYKAEICLDGDIITKSGVSEEGMVIDFADINKHVFLISTKTMVAKDEIEPIKK